MIHYCATTCEHDYPFQHSIVTTSRKVKVKDRQVMRVWTFVVCRACGHCIDHDGCPHYCHVEEGGTTIVDYELESV